MSEKINQRATFVGLFIALGLPFVLGLLHGRSPSDLEFPSKIVLLIIEEWAVTLALIAIIFFWERQTLGSIGLKKLSAGDFLWGVAGFVIGSISFVLTSPFVNMLGLKTTSAGILQLAQVPFGLRLGLVLTAGICEEILSRGYPIERLHALTGRRILSALIAYAAFVLLHTPFWGAGGTIQIGFWSLIITVLYVKRRSLAACMVMHILNDAYAFLLLPSFAQYLPR